MRKRSGWPLATSHCGGDRYPQYACRDANAPEPDISDQPTSRPSRQGRPIHMPIRGLTWLYSEERISVMPWSEPTASGDDVFQQDVNWSRPDDPFSVARAKRPQTCCALIGPSDASRWGRTAPKAAVTMSPGTGHRPIT